MENKSNGNYVALGKLEVYKLALELGNFGWDIYVKLKWEERKTIGHQFITSIDSVGANIAEGYGRFHFRDRIKFYYNSRGSLLEAKHWGFLLFKRSIISEKEWKSFLKKSDDVHKKLNLYIKSCKNNI